jgi:hypothetical protein
MGALVPEPDKWATKPTPPATCIPVVMSVTDRSQVPGSTPAAGQTLACNVVGEVPGTWNRTLSLSPATKGYRGTNVAQANSDHNGEFSTKEWFSGNVCRCHPFLGGDLNRRAGGRADRLESPGVRHQDIS